MKLLTLIFFALTLHAQEVVLHVKGKAAQHFTKEASSTVNVLKASRNTSATASDDKEVTYYYRGIKSKETTFKASRELFISFGTESSVDYEAFAKQHQLVFIREINSLFKTALFKLEGSEDIINACNRFNALSNVRNSQPNFKRYRELR